MTISSSTTKSVTPASEQPTRAPFTVSMVLPSHISLGADKSPSCCSAGQSWSERGNVVRQNLFHTVRATERLAQAATTQNAFYLDVGAQQLSPKTLLSVRFDLSADRT